MPANGIAYDAASLNEEFLTSCIETLAKLKSQRLVKVPLPKLKLLEGGEDFFYKMFSMINAAQNYIFCITYTFEDSNLANRVFEALTLSQERGVKVYLIIDDLISLQNTTRLNKFVKNGGVILTRNSIYDASLRMHNKDFFQRDHEKILFADNKFLIGSANIGIEYGGRLYGNNFFTDLNVFGKNCLIPEFANLVTNLVASMKNSFDNQQYLLLDGVLNFKKAYPLPVPFYSPWLRLEYTQQPFHMQIQTNLLRRIRNAQSSIKLIAPYFYNIKILVDHLIEAHQRGVKIEIVTSFNRDIPAYKDFTNSILFRKFLRVGIPVYEYSDHYLHSKAVMIDDSYVSVGSFNLDRWSWFNNLEANVDVEGKPKFVKSYDAVFQHYKNKSALVPQESYQGMFLRAKVRLWKTFHFLCDKLMNRANYGHYQDGESSALNRMQRSLSWDFQPAHRSQLLEQADSLVTQLPLNEIKHHLR